ncbi:MAG: RNA polymerase sigma factor [Spirochaetaceae bacterium]|nr:MAG: RNA polymerase sigma factor [Spirochaetaceae bacterium]
MVKHEFETLVRDYSPKVYNISYRITGNRQDAEDVTQETFLQVHRNLERFRGESAIYTWIYRIAVNTSLQCKRRIDKIYIDSLDETIAQFREDVPQEVKQWANDPETRYLYDELLGEVQKACYHFITFRLTDEQRVVYIPRVLLDFSLDDIAAVLQIEKNTVKARLQRAKTALGAYFSGRCQWIEGSGNCSCECGLGFALSVAPEILRRLKNLPPDEAIRTTVRKTVGKVIDIDQIYGELPLEEFQTEALESYLKGA